MLNSKPITAESSSPPAPLTSAISMLKFPFKLTKDQIEAAEAWIMNGYKGSGTGKTEIAFECAKRAYEAIVHKERPRLQRQGVNHHSTLQPWTAKNIL
jgi:hypothetical protein